MLEPTHPRAMTPSAPLEVRLEVYAEGDLPEPILTKIGAALSQRWPVTWDIRVPPKVSFEHPAEWRAIVPVPEGATAESLHGLIATDLTTLDPGLTLHYRTRWDFPDSSNQQEVYEVRWKPKRK